ncbi:MAG: hypothetical protein ACOCXA_02635 [Planctomycetota bacterium]
MPEHPPLLAEPSRRLRQALHDSGCAVIAIQTSSNAISQRPGAALEQQLRDWAEAGHTVVLCSLSKLLTLGSLGYMSLCRLNLGRNLLICLPQAEAAGLGESAVALPTHTFHHAGQVLSWLLLEGHGSRPQGDRQIRLRPV